MLSSKVLIIHDNFEIKGGGERMMLTLAQALQADLMFAYYDKTSFNLASLPGKCINLNISRGLPGVRTFNLARAFKHLQFSMDEYDCVIYSGVAAPLAVRNQTKGKSIFYCHTPPRFIYDQRAYYMQQLSWPARQGMKWLNKWFGPQYEAAIGQMDELVTNSSYVARRIEKYLNKNATVIHPPCDIEALRYISSEPFYLSTARLDGLKRVDKIISAFLQMPDKKLVVVSGGQQFDQLKKQIGNAENIELTGWISDARLKELLGRCLATIYLPIDEDFGMSPVESMAAGKPVFCSDHGGLLETVVNKKTGVYIDNGNVCSDLIMKINQYQPNELKAMRKDCEHRANQFTLKNFMCQFKELIVE